MKTRCKLKLTEKDGSNVKFECQYDENVDEDIWFTKYTPWGHAEFSIDNENVTSMLEVGQDYYFDITKAE